MSPYKTGSSFCDSVRVVHKAAPLRDSSNSSTVTVLLVYKNWCRRIQEYEIEEAARCVCVHVCARACVPTPAQVPCRKQGKTESFIAVF